MSNEPMYKGTLGAGEQKTPDTGAVKNGVAVGHKGITPEGLRDAQDHVRG